MHDLSLKEIKKEWHGSLKSYAIGFIACLLLTTLSFFLVITKPFAVAHVIYALVGLALLQAIIQLIFFLHVGQEAKPRWNTLIFYFMVLVLLIIVLGSLWIMHDLDERMMSNMPMGMTHD